MESTGPLQFGCFYHIYNRGNNRENIFIENRNYVYFMRLWVRYLVPVSDTYAYCLLRNHFHFLVRIKEKENISPRVLENKSLDRVVSRQFGNMFNAYARTINHTYGRTGALFERPFRRIEIRSESHLLYLVAYIHRNPQKHGFVDDFRSWKYSSYNSLLLDQENSSIQEEILKWFGGRVAYEEFHRQFIEVELPGGMVLET